MELDTQALERPSPKLLNYYFLCSLLTGPAIIVSLPALIIRYTMLRYYFEESGLRMTTGLIFRKEVIVAFRRIQDIHVSANVVQRWLGIATVSIQTASGNATPEIVLEGITNADQVRDWLYERLRGAKGQSAVTAPQSNRLSSSERALAIASPPENEDALALLREIRDALAIVASRKS